MFAWIDAIGMDFLVFFAEIGFAWDLIAIFEDFEGKMG